MFENSVTLYTNIHTEKPLESVQCAVGKAFRNVGGQLQGGGNVLNIFNGKQGISNAFALDCDARIVVTERKSGEYEVQCVLQYRPNQTFWACAIGGLFCLWPLWIVCAFYFTANPTPVYQAALDRVAQEIQYF